MTKQRSSSPTRDNQVKEDLVLIIETKLVKAVDPAIDHDAIQQAAQILKNGGLVALPTETVYGIAANALDSQAVAGIFAAKGRPQDNPLIVHISDIDQLAPLVAQIPPQAQALAEAFWPGPLTMILPKSQLIPSAVSAGLSTVAVRMPSLPVARAIIREAGVPVAAPSANLSGRPSPTTAQHCVEDLWGKVGLIVDGGSCQVGVESTVVSLTGDIPTILRPGAVTPAQLEQVLGKVELDPAVFSHLEEGAQVSSPGMKYKHYAPKAQVVLLTGDTKAVMNYLTKQQADGVFALVFEEDMALLPVQGRSMGPIKDSSSHAARLFGLLRELDEAGAKKIFARTPPKNDVGLAVYNRLIRAAGFREVYL